MSGSDSGRNRGADMAMESGAQAQVGTGATQGGKPTVIEQHLTMMGSNSGPACCKAPSTDPAAEEVGEY